ncbi:MAG: right-handed parallel beta-helix repeat-containing protein, partial [Thermoplasmata archaeon]|nr:right-handed parallel beta-helix repeat-containing protein [Thermoplasmata archaeon]
GVRALRAWYCDLVDNNVTYNCGGEAGVYLTLCRWFAMERNNISASTGVGLQVYESTNCTFRNNTICDNGRTTGSEGLYLYDAHDNVFENNNVSDNPNNGITLGGMCTDNVLRYNEVHGNAYAGISIPSYSSGSSWTILRKNNISRNQRDGIAVLGGDGNNIIARNIVIHNNVVSSDNYAGIRIDGCDQNTIEGNTVSRNPRYGVHMLNSDSNEVIGNEIVFNCGGQAGLRLDYVDDSLFENNNITNSTGNGVDMWYSDGNQWTGNRINSNDQLAWGFAGVYAAYCDWNNWTDDTIAHNTDDGVRTDTCSYWSFVTCIFINNTDGVDLLNSDNMTFEACTFHRNQGNSGVRIVYSEVCRVLNSTATNNTFGIYLYGTSWSLVEGNHVSGNLASGIFLEKSSHKNAISWNNVTWNNVYGATSRAGIHVKGSGLDRIEDNVVEDNYYVGIFIDSSNNCSVSRNEVHHTKMNAAGIQTQYAADVEISWNNVSNNSCSGIDNYESADLWIHNNTVNGNAEAGISNGAIYGHTVVWVTVADNVVIAGNNDIVGMVLNYCTNWTIFGNDVAYNLRGLSMYQCDNITVVNNSFRGSSAQGIYATSSKHSRIAYNEVFDNEDYGVLMNNCDDISVFLNNFHQNNHNGTQGYDDTGTNVWDNGTQGNYWSDYAGPDRNGDGIGDWPYNLTGGAGARDAFPLMNATMNDAPVKVQELPLVAAACAVLALSIIIDRRRKR